MFRQVAHFFPGHLDVALPSSVSAPPPAPRNAHALLAAHPYPLARLMERVWLEYQAVAPAPAPLDLRMPPVLFSNEGNGGLIDRVPLGLPVVGMPYVTPWDHLIYAYFVENTRAFEICKNIVREYVIGERLSAPSANPEALVWVRTTEALFLRDASLFPIGDLVSHARPDFAATRRNAYFRVFGMDLNHGADDGRPYAYEKPEAANRDFVRLFEDLLAAVWLARANRNNGIGTNPTDEPAIARTVTLLQELLNLRKQGGVLRREEFVIVSMMSWFHLTMSFNSPIVNLLNANATTPGERLIRAGQRVGISAHPRSREFFELAEDMSILLRLIESGMLSSPVTVQWLWEAWSPLAPIIDNIVNLWSLVTGRELKSVATRVAGTSPQLPAPVVPRAMVTPNAVAIRN